MNRPSSLGKQDNRKHQSHRDILEEGKKGMETRDTMHGDRQSQGGLAVIDCYDDWTKFFREPSFFSCFISIP